MKKYILIAVCVLLASCDGSITESQGKKNARQYVKEHIYSSVTINSEDVERIDVSDPDTILSDNYLVYSEFTLIDAKAEFLNQEITFDSLCAVTDRISQYITDYAMAAEFGADKELRARYTDDYRLSYPVTIRMKSGETKTVSVVMHKDGTTPYNFLHVLLKDLDKYQSAIMDALSIY